MVAVFTVTKSTAEASQGVSEAAAAKDDLRLLLVRWYGKPDDERQVAAHHVCALCLMWHELLEAAKQKEAAAAKLKGSQGTGEAWVRRQIQGKRQAAGQDKRVHFI